MAELSGKREGERIGEQIGERIGEQRGERIGEQRGELKKAKSTTGKLYAMGLDVEKIAGAVDYPVETIKEWLGLD